MEVVIMSSISTIQELRDALFSLANEYEGSFELVLFDDESDYGIKKRPRPKDKKTLLIAAIINGQLVAMPYYYNPNDSQCVLFNTISGYTITLQDVFDKIYCELAYGS